MADAPDLTLFHSEDLESRLKSLDTAFLTEKYAFPRKMNQFSFINGETKTFANYASSWYVYLVSEHYAGIHGLCMITVAPNTMHTKTDIGGNNNYLTFSVSGNDLVVKASARINMTIIWMGNS